ncbi:MAG: hypothetical protein ACRD2A_26205, partial [Vicinamibacterales bacterium]
MNDVDERLALLIRRHRRCRIGALWLWAMAGLAPAWLGSATVQAETPIAAGDVAAVRVWAYGTPFDGSGKRDLLLSDPVYVRERLETVPDGALHVRLSDDTMLRLGSASIVVLDEFIYRPDAGVVSP